MEKRSDDGSKPDDSILLRITKQQNNCKCHVNLETSATYATINISKQDGTTNSTHDRLHCGLAVDIKHVDKRILFDLCSCLNVQVGLVRGQYLQEV